MQTWVGGLAGLVFGLGLIVAGMVDPSKVLGFLDVAGTWNPSLAFVMAGGIAVALPAFAWVALRQLTLLGNPLHLPKGTQVDRRLVGGSLLFGVGWGLAGLCPGPALVVAGTGDLKALGFVAAMVAGLWLFEWLEAR